MNLAASPHPSPHPMGRGWRAGRLSGRFMGSRGEQTFLGILNLRVSVRTGEGKNGEALHFRVTTRRGKQFNSLVYADVDPLNGATRDAVLMNPDDAAALHLIHGDYIALNNDIGRYEGRVFLAPLARGNLQIHWPEGNVIIRRGVTDPQGGVPAYKASVTIERIC